MGKVRRIRDKYHLSLKKNTEESQNDTGNSQISQWSNSILPAHPLPQAFQVNQNVNQPGIFAGIKIDTDSLVKRLPDCDAHSVTSATY